MILLWNYYNFFKIVLYNHCVDKTKKMIGGTPESTCFVMNGGVDYR
jgi:hypothetical protein